MLVRKTEVTAVSLSLEVWQARTVVSDPAGRAKMMNKFA